MNLNRLYGRRHSPPPQHHCSKMFLSSRTPYIVTTWLLITNHLYFCITFPHPEALYPNILIPKHPYTQTSLYPNILVPKHPIPTHRYVRTLLGPSPLITFMHPSQLRFHSLPHKPTITVTVIQSSFLSRWRRENVGVTGNTDQNPRPFYIPS